MHFVEHKKEGERKGGQTLKEGSRTTLPGVRPSFLPSRYADNLQKNTIAMGK